MLVIASGSVIVRDNKILLVKHGDVFWKFCGGKVDYVNGESLDSAAKREAKEELDLEINIINSEPFLLYTAKENSDSLVDIILVHYLADFSGEIRPGKDIEQWAWINLDSLDKEDLAPNIIPTLEYFKII
jgi:nucleoside triphosphatase